MHTDRLLKMVRTGSIIGVLLLAMFVIDMRESFKFQSQSHSAHDHSNTIVSGGRLQEYYQYQSQYFRAQRNYYLSGFSLFLLVYARAFLSAALAHSRLRQSPVPLAGHRKHFLARAGQRRRSEEAGPFPRPSVRIAPLTIHSPSVTVSM
jgi:hypothetical protein